MRYKSLWCLGVLAVLVSSAQAGLVFVGDYESGTFAGFTTDVGLGTQPLTAPTRAGRYAARFMLAYNDPKRSGGKRTEVAAKVRGQGIIGGRDEWYGFSIYLPPEYAVDDYRVTSTTCHYACEVLAQWHNPPDGGEIWRIPPLFLVTDGPHWRMQSRSTGVGTQKSQTEGLVVVSHFAVPFQTGVWTDWVVQVRWSCRDAPPLNSRCQAMPAGFVRVWKDGKQLVDYHGPTSYNDTNPMHFKWGIYKSMVWNANLPTKVTQRVLYNDELRIGDSASSYAEVAPGGPRPPAPSPGRPSAPTQLRTR